jgi:RNA polymerase primary sigma factor
MLLDVCRAASFCLACYCIETGGLETAVIQELLARADQRGYVTYRDVIEIVDVEGGDSNTVELLLETIDELGIEFRHRDDFDPSRRSSYTLSANESGHDPNVMDELAAVAPDDPVGLYFRQMALEPLLTAQEEIKLARQIELGREALFQLGQAAHAMPRPARHALETLAGEGQIAREHLGRANTRLVVSIAKRYIGQGLPFPDLIQEGNVGLMRAVDKYDHNRGNRFSTYATWWIRQAITRALAQKTRTIRIPLHMTERIRQMYRTAQTLEQDLGRRPSPEEIASEMKMPADTIRGMMDASQHAIALERPIGEDGDSEFGDFIEDVDTPTPVESATQNLLQETIEEVLSELTPRQSHIIRLRFGLGGGEPHTLEEIANKFGLSRERIRQLEKEALRRLRHPRLAYNLRDYLE